MGFSGTHLSRWSGLSCGLTEIHAGADVPNEPSFAVMTRLGMSPHRELIVAGRPVRYHRLTSDADLHQL